MLTVFAVAYTGIVAIALALMGTRPSVVAPIIASLFISLPLFKLGGSSSSGIFVFDVLVILAAALQLLGVSNINLKLFRNGPTVAIVGLTVFTVVSTIFNLLMSQYGYYTLFGVYGIYRWILYLIFFALVCGAIASFGARTLFLACSPYLLVFNTAAICAQFGLIDLSGWLYIGADRLYEIDYFATNEVKRYFLGAPPAAVAPMYLVWLISSSFISSQIIRARLLLISSAMALVGSGSTTDLFASLMAAIPIAFLALRSRSAVMFVSSLILLTIALSSVLLFADSFSLQKLASSNVLDQFSGRQAGTFSYRIAEWLPVIEHLLEQPTRLLLGYGINEFRMMWVQGITNIGFGHNAYLHLVGEIGAIGTLLVLSAIFLALREAWRGYTIGQSLNQRVAYLLIVFFLMQRLAAGVTVDAFFAVDNMLPSTEALLIIIAATVRRKPKVAATHLSPIHSRQPL